MNGISPIKAIINNINKSYIVTSLGVRMRNPTDKNGKWIGWTAEEVVAHLNSCRNYINTLPKSVANKK